MLNQKVKSMATVDDLPVLVQASAQSLADLWAYVREGDNQTLKDLVTSVHHTTSDALDVACEVFGVERETLLPPPPEKGPHTESVGGDKPPRGG